MGRKKKNAVDTWRKDHQDPLLKKKLERLAEVLNIASVVASVGFMILHTWPWLVGCILTLAAALVLALIFPAYFSLVDAPKGEYQYGISLVIVECINAIALVTGQWYTLDVWWQPIPWAVAITIVVVALLAWFSRDFQRAGSAAAAVVCTFALSCFLVCQMNAYLDFSRPEHRGVTVLELDRSSGRRGRHYDCFVDLEGEKIRIEIPGKLYNQLEQGDTVCLDVHKGLLGIGYMELHTLE